MRRLGLLILATGLLSGCSWLGLDAGDETPGEAKTALLEPPPAAEPPSGPRLDPEHMLSTCHDRFAASLGTLKVSYPNGPTIVRSGETVTMTLEAEPLDPTLLDPKRFVCVFDSGVLSSAQAE